jgi:hypothetical protein
VAALAGWAVLAAAELVFLLGALRLFTMMLGPELLASLKVVLDMAVLTACGFIAGRVGRPRTMAAAGVTAAGLMAFDLTPYVLLNVSVAPEPRLARFTWLTLGRTDGENNGLISTSFDVARNTGVHLHDAAVLGA